MKYRVISMEASPVQTDDREEAFRAFAKIVAAAVKERHDTVNVDGFDVRKLESTIEVHFRELNEKELSTYPNKNNLSRPYVLMAFFQRDKELIGVAEGFNLKEWTEVGPGYISEADSSVTSIRRVSGAEADEALGWRYGVMKDAEFVWKGFDETDAMIYFAKAITEKALEMSVDSEARIEFTKGPRYVGTDKESIVASIGQTVVAVMVGVTMDSWMKKGPMSMKDEYPDAEVPSDKNRIEMGKAIGEIGEQILANLDRALKTREAKRKVSSPWGKVQTLH